MKYAIALCFLAASCAPTGYYADSGNWYHPPNHSNYVLDTQPPSAPHGNPCCNSSFYTPSQARVPSFVPVYNGGWLK